MVSGSVQSMAWRELQDNLPNSPLCFVLHVLRLDSQNKNLAQEKNMAPENSLPFTEKSGASEVDTNKICCKV